jgi:phosphoglycolate phosphatase
VKLAAFGLEKWLDLESGAYGSDHEDRRELVPIALEHLASLRGLHLTPEETWVVGDTPRDFECAEAGGAHCLLVATGSYSVEDLAPLGADATLPDLSDTPAVTRLLTQGL